MPTNPESKEIPTMFWGVVDVSKIDHCCRSTIDHLHASSELAPKSILGRMHSGSEVSFGHIYTDVSGNFSYHKNDNQYIAAMSGLRAGPSEATAIRGDVCPRIQVR